MRGVFQERREDVRVTPDSQRRPGRRCRFPRGDGIIGHAAMLDADVRQLHERGFVVLHGAVPPREMDRMSRAYDAAVASASPEDVKVGSSTTRVNDFVNRGAEFDCLYICPPLLDVCGIVIGAAFRLSSLHARTL